MTIQKWCSATTVLLGAWNYTNNVMNQSGAAAVMQFCPNYFARLSNVPFVKAYACGPYQEATLLRDCDLFPLQDTLRQLTEESSMGKVPIISFVGDSLANQLRVETECMSEYFTSTPFSARYIYSPYLRTDLPCKSACFTNATFLSIKRHDHGHHSCEGCMNGKLNNTFEARFGWVAQVPRRTKILVVNGGTWYTRRTIEDDSDAVYRDTMISVATILRIFVEEGMSVFWYEIPPTVSVDGRLHSEWERTRYAIKNAFARSVLAGTGVVFLNITPAATARKLEEAARQTSASSDGLHWCSPGPFAFTRTVLESILHLYMLKNYA